MAYWVEDTKFLSNNKAQTSFGMDSLADIAILPKMSERVQPGSDAFAALEKRLVILNSEGEWV